MNFYFYQSVILAALVPQVLLIELSVVNSCGYPIWLATTPNFGEQPLPDGNVRVEQGQKYVYQVS